MISNNLQKPEIKKEKVVHAGKNNSIVPFYCMDSQEVDFIREKIKSNKEYLSKCTSQSLYKKIEKDTIFLENNILPILLAKTNLFFNDTTKLFVNSLDKAIQSECNALLFYTQISDNYKVKPKLAVSNIRDNPDELGNSVSVFAVNLGETIDNFEYPYFNVQA